MTQRRRKRRAGFKKRPHSRPGATFKVNSWWKERRKGESPETLAHTDWLVFRRAENPFRPTSYRYKRYAAAFSVAKLETPDPGFPPLTSVSPAHGKPPKIHVIHYKQVTITTTRRCPLWEPPTETHLPTKKE